MSDLGRGGKHVKKGRPGGKKRAVIITICVILTVVVAVAAVGYGVFRHYYGLMRHGIGATDGDNYWEDPEGGADADQDDVTDADGDLGVDVPPSTDEEIEDIEGSILDNLREIEENSDLYKTDSFNIMLIGVDSRRDSFSGRSDAMILVSIDRDGKKVTMTSFLRDIYCAIPGHSGNRLNTAYEKGGAELLKSTVKANFGIDIDRCVIVNFRLVSDMVDAVGGIDLELTSEEIRVMNRIIGEQDELLDGDQSGDTLPREDGTYHLNGDQALAYARVRYVGTDFARTGRQRTVIMKCLDKIGDMGIGELGDLAEEFLPRVRTDLTEGDCASLLLMAVDLSDYEFKSLTVPVDGSWSYADIRGMDVITIDFKKNSEAWHEAVEGD